MVFTNLVLLNRSQESGVRSQESGEERRKKEEERRKKTEERRKKEERRRKKEEERKELDIGLLKKSGIFKQDGNNHKSLALTVNQFRELLLIV